MIRRLRKAHRFCFALLSVLLPVGLALAVLSRPEERSDPEGYEKLVEIAQPQSAPDTFVPFLSLDTAPFALELAFTPERNWVAVTPLTEPGVADLWIIAAGKRTAKEASATLPLNTQLVGALNSVERVTYPWPQDAERLIFYSLAKSKVLGEIDVSPATTKEVR